MSVKKPCWQLFENSTTQTCDILLHDVIGFMGDDSESFLTSLNNYKDVPVNVDVNSPGGKISDGMSISNALVNHPSPVNISISGSANSIAAVLSQGGDKPPLMYNNTVMMLHPPYIRGEVELDEKGALDLAESLKIQNGNIINTLMRHATVSKEAMVEMVASTTWMNSEMAAKAGLARLANEATEIKNFYNFAEYGYPDMPKEIKEIYKNQKRNTFFNNFPNILKPNNKEPERMKTVEYENKISDLELKNQALETENKKKDLSIENLTSENAALKEADAKRAEEALDKDLDTFVNGLISDCKLAPVNKEQTVAKLKALNSNEDLFNNEKKLLEGANKIVDDSMGGFDNGNDPVDEAAKNAKLENLVNERMKNAGEAYSAALVNVLATNPELN